MMRKLLLLSFLLLSQKFFAQHTLPMNDELPGQLDFFYNNSDGHSAIKPFLDVDLRSRKITGDSSALNIPVYTGRQTWKAYYQRPRPEENALTAAAGFPAKTALLIRPVYDFQVGKDLQAKRTLWTTSGGFILTADYEARFVSGISVIPNYQKSIAQFSGTMPGWGDRAYPMGNAKYSFQHFSGNITWRPSKIFNLQVGRDKHFWGDGYRSLFLSDLSAAYPYIRQQTTIWKLQYTSLFAWLQDWTNSAGFASGFRSKFTSSHYLSFNAAKWLNIGVFETVVWQGTDENRTRWFDPNYLNPLVFFRPVEYSLGSSDNAMLGLSFKVRFNSNNQLYGQLILDEFYLKEIKNWSRGWWANKQGIQLGYKCFNFAMVKNLFMQAEVNIVRPYTYAHGSPQQSYSNGGMPLAHPLGANFAELFGMLSWYHKGLTLTGKLVGARYGIDQAGKNFGHNIFASYLDRSVSGDSNPDYGHRLFDGIATNMFYVEFRAAYRLRTAFPIRIEFTAGARSENNVTARKKSSYITGGLVLPLWKRYADY
jgi:hypothetical protein